MAENNRLKTIGEGEVTGHAHRITAQNARVDTIDQDVRYLTNPETTGITHEEHKEIIVIGDRIVFGQMEIDPDTEEARQVKD